MTYLRINLKIISVNLGPGSLKTAVSVCSELEDRQVRTSVARNDCDCCCSVLVIFTADGCQISLPAACMCDVCVYT